MAGFFLLIWTAINFLPRNLPQVHSASSVSIKARNVIPRPTIRPTHTPVPTTPPTSTPKPTILPQTLPQKSDTFMTAINAIRTEHGQLPIVISSLLCTIADTRAHELFSHGSLDNHAGFSKFIPEIAQTYSPWWEITYTQSGTDLAPVQAIAGWLASEGHRKALLTPEATHACARIHNNFAVGILAKQK